VHAAPKTKQNDRRHLAKCFISGKVGRYDNFFELGGVDGASMQSRLARMSQQGA